MGGIPSYLNFLRIWIGFVAIMAFGNSLQCYLSENYLFQRLYTRNLNNKEQNGLSSRLFGTWTLLAGVLRLCCALNITNPSLYNATLFSFVLVQCHFLSEVFYYQTAGLTAGVAAPLIVSNISILLMLIGYKSIPTGNPRIDNMDGRLDILNSTVYKKPKKSTKAN